MVMYLSGAFASRLMASPHPNLGLMINPDMWNDLSPLATWKFGADNGCYSKGDSFDSDAWLSWLGALAWCRENCLFAVAPDVLGDARATLKRSLPFLPRIAALGLPGAYVTQNGCTVDLVPWDQMDVLFIGGDNAWKLSEESYALCAEAKRRGKRVHMGRVNSVRRLRACAASGFDSADGTLLAFGEDRNWPVLWRGIQRLEAQPAMGLWRGR